MVDLASQTNTEQTELTFKIRGREKKLSTLVRAVRGHIRRKFGIRDLDIFEKRDIRNCAIECAKAQERYWEIYQQGHISDKTIPSFVESAAWTWLSDLGIDHSQYYTNTYVWHTGLLSPKIREEVDRIRYAEK